MRSFIGIDLSMQSKLALDTWRQKALPEIAPKAFSTSSKSNTRAFPVAVPVANFHMTLAFLGDITDRQHESLCQLLTEIASPPFTVTLDSTGVWDGPKILFAAPSSPPEELMSLARDTRTAARAQGISIDGKAFRPHVTLVRKATSAFPPPLFMPDTTFNVAAFHLFESVSGPGGVRYPIRQSWQLKPALSIREQLRRGI